MKRIRNVFVATMLVMQWGQVSEARLSISQIRNHRESIVSVLSGGDKLPTRADKNLKIGFRAYKRDFVLNLAPSSVVDELETKTYVVDDEGTHEIPTINYSYAGVVEGQEDSIATVTLVNGSLSGVVIVNGTIYGIEPRKKYDANDTSGGIVVYRASENPMLDNPDGPDGALDQTEEAESASEYASRVARTVAPDGVTVAAGGGGRILLSNGTLKRLDLGLVADYPFVTVVHAGNVDNAIADMDSAINVADALTRGSAPRAKGSVAVTMRVTQRVAYATEAAQVTDGIARCNLTCRTASTLAPGNRCSSNTDCSGAGVTCQQAPDNIKTCSGGTQAGKTCIGNADCASPGTCTGSEVNPKLCRGGSDDGKICQTTNCSTYGNCCAGGAACQGFATRIGDSVGLYRTSNTHAITTSNSGKVHLFSGCRLFGSYAANKICDTAHSEGSWSLTQHWEGDDALSNAGVFAHENGHTLGAPHDNQPDVSDCGALQITRKVCASGSDQNKMCDDTYTCAGGAACSVDNKRTCSSGSNPGAYCIDNADCTGGGTCGGPKNRLCVGGANDGQVCNQDYSMCTGGTCTGAPMNWGIYPMSGSGILGGYSPCSRGKINAILATASCLTALDCGDVNKSTGAITSADALAALSIATAGTYDDLADVYPFGSVDGSVTNADSTYLLGVAVGSNTAPTTCGQADTW